MTIERTKRKTSTQQSTEGIDDLLPKGDLATLTPTDLGMTSIETMFYSKYKIKIEDAPRNVRVVHERMMTYIKGMDVNVPIFDPRVGAQNQVYLFQTFLKALSQTDTDLFMAVDLIVAHIRENAKGAFSSRMVYRFIKNIKRDQEEVQSYLKILEIFILISDPTKRNEVAKGGIVRNAVGAIDPRFKDAAFNLVTYLSQE